MDRLMTDDALESFLKQIYYQGKDDLGYPDHQLEKDIELIQTQKLLYAKSEHAKGHWYAGVYGRDANGFEVGYKCNCGFMAQNKLIIDGHVDWKKEEQKRGLNNG